MSLREKKLRALRMRKAGKTYTEIKRKVRVSKSTLSLWLREMPLSSEQMKLVRDLNPLRIEKYRETRRRIREDRWKNVYINVSRQIGSLSDREMLLAGLFLYWGEGGKTEWTTTVLSNTDPSMLKFFVRWLSLLRVDVTKIKVRLHLYADMNVENETMFWAKTLSLPLNAFRKPRVKSSKREDINYRTKNTHGTCDVILGHRDTAEYVQMALKYLRTIALQS